MIYGQPAERRQGVMVAPESCAMGADVALYDYSGLGMDLGDFGGPLETVASWVGELPSWAHAVGLLAAGVGVYAVASGAVGTMGKKPRSNPRRRKTSRRRRSSK